MLYSFEESHSDCRLIDRIKSIVGVREYEDGRKR